MQRILVVGPSPDKSKGGLAAFIVRCTVMKKIKNSL